MDYLLKSGPSPWKQAEGLRQMTFFFKFFIHFKSVGQASPLVKPQTKFEKLAIFWHPL